MTISPGAAAPASSCRARVESGRAGTLELGGRRGPLGRGACGQARPLALAELEVATARRDEGMSLEHGQGAASVHVDVQATFEERAPVPHRDGELLVVPLRS